MVLFKKNGLLFYANLMKQRYTLLLLILILAMKYKLCCSLY